MKIRAMTGLEMVRRQLGKNGIIQMCSDYGPKMMEEKDKVEILMKIREMTWG